MSFLLPLVLRAQLRSSLLYGKVFVAAESGEGGRERWERPVGVIACFGPGEELRGAG